MSRNISTRVPQLPGLGGLVEHGVHHLTQLVHVTAQHMTVHIQRRGNVAVAQPTQQIF